VCEACRGVLSLWGIRDPWGRGLRPRQGYAQFPLKQGHPACSLSVWMAPPTLTTSICAFRALLTLPFRSRLSV